MTRHEAQNRGRPLAHRGDAIKLILDAHVGATEKPFFMDYATGAGHAPRLVPKSGPIRYEGQFDGGWDAYRETVFQRQNELEGLSCGHDFGAPLAHGYEPPFAFTGTIHQVVVDVADEMITDDEAEIARLMAQQ